MCNQKHTLYEHINAHERTGGNMESNAKDIVQKVQEIKKSKNIKYQDILDAMTENGVPALSLSTLRRVFTCDSETQATRFNFEETLLPILDAIKRIDGTTDDSPAEENKALRIIIDLQDKELDRKDALIKRLIDRLDQKDEIIKKLLEKCL